MTGVGAGAASSDRDRAGIRSYAKFVDVAAKATALVDGEAGVWRHERLAIEELRALLDEMR